MEQVKMIPIDVLKSYFIYAYRTDDMGKYRVYLCAIKLTYQKVPDPKKSTKNKLVYSSNEKKLIPASLDWTENYLGATIFNTKEEVKMNLDAIEHMNSVLKIRNKNVLKWDYVQIGDLLNQLKKENRLPKNIVKM